MGSLPNYSILKGENRPFKSKQLYRIFEKVADEVCSETVAITFEDECYNNQRCISNLTYKQLNCLSNKLARRIVERVTTAGSQPNTDGDYIVAVCMTPSDKLITTLLAIWKAGCAYLPLDPTFPKNRIEHILNESKPVLVIYENSQDIDQSAFESIFSLKHEELCLESEKYHESNLQSNEQFHHANVDLGIVLYTSGSTGVPKGVRLPFTSILNRLQWQWYKFPYSYTEKNCIFKTALTFVDSVCEIWGPLLSGLTIVVVPKYITKDPVKLVALMDQYQIERLVLVPSLLQSLILYLSLEKNVNPLKSLKLWICSGEPLSVQLAEEFFKYFKGQRILCNFYGSTEIMGDVTSYTITDPSQLQGFDKVPIGVPLDNTIIYLLDNDMKPVPIGSVGELYVSGLNLAAGYVNGRDPDKFIENPLVMDLSHCRLYKTGDFASIVKGVIQYEGRTDSQVKVRGNRVDLSEVEKALTATPGVEKAVVLCYKPGEMDQALVSFITHTADRPNISGLQIEEYLQQKLISYMIPQVFVLDNIPLLVNGKIDRQTLLKMYASTNNNDDSELQLDIDYTEVPEDKMDAAKVLFETVGSVIGRSTRLTLNLQSNFYQLGGNSLNSIYTVTKLREQGYTIGITDFIRAANMNEILQKMHFEPADNMANYNMIQHDYRIEMLRNEHKHDAIGMIATSFYEKADVEAWLKPDFTRNDYSEFLDKIWETVVEKDLSYVVYDKNDEIVGVAFNFDADDEPEIHTQSKLSYVFELLDHIEHPVRNNMLPSGKGAVLHCSMLATSDKSTPQENVLLIQAMEEELIRLAKRKHFLGILTTNTSPLTQQLGTDIFGYKVMNAYQVNQFVASDKSRPFNKAPDSQKVMVSWKEV